MLITAGCAGGRIKTDVKAEILDSKELLEPSVPVRWYKVRLETGEIYEWSENFFGTLLRWKLLKDGKVIGEGQ